MKRYIVAIDQSTSASKVFLVDEQGEITRKTSRNHQQFYPQPGYAEHDAEEIWRNTRAGISEVCQGIEPSAIAALAISNQRETTVLWDRKTGEPVRRAVVWQDVRAEAFCKQRQEHAELVRRRTGLALSPYYPAAKAACVLRDDPALRRRAENGELCVSTIDAYLIYRLTNGRVFRTDMTNASRTAWMSLRTLQWDAELCKLFGMPIGCLPEIVPSDADFGRTALDGLDIPIIGVLGDSHAALFGQGCLTQGKAKATFGTGSSVMLNIGDEPILSGNGLSTSVAFAEGGRVCYALEGNVTCSGDTLCWLRDEARMIDQIADAETIAASVPDTGGVYLVPAFSGLGAPYFDGEARAALIGMSRATTRAHIVRAALDSMAYQDADVLRAMARDTGRCLTELNADGGPTGNALLMQRLADLIGCEVRCAVQNELSALGAAYLAGIRVGVYPSLEAIPARSRKGASYMPRLSESERTTALRGWQDAVQRCLKR